MRDQPKQKLLKILEQHCNEVENKSEPVLKTPIKHSIHLNDNIPMSLPARPLPYSQREEVLKQVETLSREAIIAPSTSLYSAPIVTVRKSYGSLRLCVDYRVLNLKTIPATFPIPRLNEMLDRLKGATYLTVIDIKSAYYNIVEESDQSKTAFVIPTGKFEFKLLPFGLIGAPFTFAQAMTHVLQGLEEFLTSHFDDILVFSPSLESYFKHLELLMKRLAEYRLPIKYSKCQFVKTEVKFIGHVVNETGYKPEVTKISEIVEFKRPTSVTKLRRFLALLGFIANLFQSIAKKLCHSVTC